MTRPPRNFSGGGWRVLASVFLLIWIGCAGLGPGTSGRTVLGIEGSRFILHGKPTFLLGFSYFGALGAPEEFIRKDLDDFQRRKFNWLRVWATWSAFGTDVSAVDGRGEIREPFMGKLKLLVAECDRRGMVVDVTLTRGKESSRKAAEGRVWDFESHRRAAIALVKELQGHRNWYLDLANEHDVRDERHVPNDELKKLREEVRRLDPRRLVTASYGGHDLSAEVIRECLVTIGLDFLCPHRPRNAESPGQTEAKTRWYLATMKEIRRMAPVQYQEPFRRGYEEWQPKADDFSADLRGAEAGGGAGWCFHNGAERGAAEHRRPGSFDLHKQRLIEQLDEEEREFVGRQIPQIGERSSGTVRKWRGTTETVGQISCGPPGHRARRRVNPQARTPALRRLPGGFNRT